MVNNDLVLIDSTYYLKTCETTFLGAALFPGPNGEDHTRTFGFVRDIFRIRNSYGIRNAIIVFGKESVAATSETVLSDIVGILQEMQVAVVRQDNFLVGEICKQISSGKWILTDNRDMLQLVSVNLSIIMANNSDMPEFVTMTEITNLGIEPEQIPALLALSEDKDAPLKKQKAIRLLQIYKYLEAILADCTTSPSADWKRKLSQQKEYLINKEVEHRFRGDISIVFPIPIHTTFIVESENSANALSGYGFRSLVRSLPLSTSPAIKIETKDERKTDYRAIRNSADLQYLENLLSKADLCALDTETSGKDPRSATLYGISLSIKEKEAFFVPMLKSDLDGLSPEDVRTWLNRVLHKDMKFVGHNLKYDFAVLHRNGISVQLLHFDTMLAAYECFGDWELWNLAAVAKKLLGVTIKRYKEIVGKGETFLDRPFAELVEHACCDVDITLRLHSVLNRELRKRKLDCTFFDETMRVENIILDCEQNGVRIDVERMAVHSDALKNRMDSLRTAAISCAGCEFDVDSPKSSTDILRKLGIWEKTAQSVGDAQLEQLASSHDLPFLISKYRRTRKQYKEADALCAAAIDGRIFPALSQIKSGHGSIWSNSPVLEEAIATQAVQDKQLLDILPCSETALLNLRDISGDTVLQVDLNDYKRGGNFIPCDFGIRGVTHCKIILYIATGLPDATVCRKLLIDKTQAVQIRTAITSRYEQLFEWLDQFKRFAIEQGYVEYAGRRKYLDGLRSSDIDKRTKAVRSAIRWLIRY